MKFIIITAIVLLVLIYNASSLGVSQDYLANDTIELIEGTSRLHSIRIQNPSQNEVTIKLTYDNAYLKVIDREENDEYAILPKTTRKIFFNVTAENLKPNEIHDVGYTVHQVSGSGDGVPILVKIAKNFKIKVVRDTNKFYLPDYFDYAPHIAVIGAVLFLLFRWKSKKALSWKKQRK